MHSLSQSMQECIRDCLLCYQICRRDAMNHCLETGGRHVEPRHFRIMIGCAELCRTAADVMLSNLDVHGSVCAACADTCEACAQSCAGLEGMDECAQACRRCAQSCRKFAGAVALP